MRSPVKFLLETPVLSPIRIAAYAALAKVLAQRHIAMVPTGDEPYRMPAYDLIRATRQQTRMVLLDPEAYSVYSTAMRTGKIPGEIAEVGVYRGGSARLISEVKGNRALHLFDTFAGLPETSPEDSALFQKGGFVSSFEQVKLLLQPFPNVHFHVGLFPETAAGLEHLRFSFVHLDVDLYRSTATSLAWFYPRMNPGAVLISHDYVNAEGVRKAFEEFFADKPECLIELAGTQVAFVKL